MNMRTGAVSALLIVVGCGLFAYGLSTHEGSGGGTAFGGGFGGFGGGWSSGYPSEGRICIVFGALAIAVGIVLRTHPGVVPSAIGELFASLEFRRPSRRALAREWLIVVVSLSCAAVLMPPTFAIRDWRDVIDPTEPGTLARRTRALVQDQQFQSLAPERRLEVFRAFASKADPDGFAKLDEQSQGRAAGEVIRQFTPKFTPAQIYGVFYGDFSISTLLLLLIPYALIQLGRSTLWAVRSMGGPR